MMRTSRETDPDYPGVIIQNKYARICVDRNGSAWVLQKRKRDRWMHVIEAQTRVQLLTLWCPITGDDGADLFQLPERFSARLVA